MFGGLFKKKDNKMILGSVCQFESVAPYCCQEYDFA